tara:strand:+ start:257 stop:502 length:246 start_codon:yes stop_codon:yes gene_type:complete
MQKFSADEISSKLIEVLNPLKKTINLIVNDLPAIKESLDETSLHEVANTFKQSDLDNLLAFVKFVVEEKNKFPTKVTKKKP